MNRTVSPEGIMPVVILGMLFSSFLIFIPHFAEAATHEVTIVRGATNLGDRSYSPNPIEIVKGDTIRFINGDTVLHTASSGDGSTKSGVFDTGYLAPDRSAEVTINEVGDFPYYCELHPLMVGLVRVSDAPLPRNEFKVIVLHDDNLYEVTGSSASDIRATRATINPSVSVVVNFDGTGDVELTFPTSMIQGISSVSASNGTTIEFTKSSETDSKTTIKFAVPDGGNSVVITGTRVVPEFSAFALFAITASVLVASIVIARLSGRMRAMSF